LATAILGIGLAVGVAAVSGAQAQDAAGAGASTSAQQSTPANPPQATAPAANAPPAPMPLPTPSMSGPLATAVPHEFDAGPLGKLDVTGILSGVGITGGDHFPGNQATLWDVSNGQVFVQKTTGWWQFYLQAGAYNIPDLGAPLLSTSDTLPETWGALPVGYFKFVKGNFSAEIGALPTLLGAEYTFSFENMNIERGLLWNQENVINRGIQLNYTHKKWTGSISWNDGFYSNRYTWITGSVAYAFNAANTLSFVAGGNAGQYDKNTFATPEAFNNEQVYDVIYTYTKGPWIVTPYFQYTNVPTILKFGINGASTAGGALLATYSFKHGISLSVRPEYITSSGNFANGTANLLYGPGSNAFSFTITPTYVKGAFFARGEFAIVHAGSITPGDAFGPLGTDANQPRGAVEMGFLF
jgi:Putative beta-barrel porin-2, OmpL-like. bbp2